MSEKQTGFGEDVSPPTAVLGHGWHELENDESGPFRWIGEEAIAFAAVFYDAECDVTIDLEPGPSVPSSFFLIEVYEGEFVRFSDLVAGRRAIRFALPPCGPGVRRFRIRIHGGGLACDGDTRILNARVYLFTVLPSAPDVVPRWRGLGIRRGWYRREQDEKGDGCFRWVNNDAVIEIAHPVGSFELEVEPGPGLGIEPLRLHVFESNGAQVAQFVVRERERIRIDLSTIAAYPARLRLHCTGGGQPTLPDARTLNFRAFAIASPWDPSEVLRGLKRFEPPTTPVVPGESVRALP